VRGNVTRHHGAGLNDRTFSDSDIWKNDTVGADKNILFNHDTAVAILLPSSPIKMREDRSAKPDRDTITDTDPFGMDFIDINKLADPDLPTDLNPPNPVKPGPNTFPTRNNESNFMQNSIEKIP
jgi:hypothetical protein